MLWQTRLLYGVCPQAPAQAAYVRVHKALMIGTQGGWLAGLHPLADLQGAALTQPPGTIQVAGLP